MPKVRLHCGLNLQTVYRILWHTTTGMIRPKHVCFCWKVCCTEECALPYQLREVKQLQLFRRKSGKYPTTKETKPNDASSKFPAVMCPLSNTSQPWSWIHTQSMEARRKCELQRTCRGPKLFLENAQPQKRILKCDAVRTSRNCDMQCEGGTTKSRSCKTCHLECLDDKVYTKGNDHRGRLSAKRLCCENTQAKVVSFGRKTCLYGVVVNVKREKLRKKTFRFLLAPWRWKKRLIMSLWCLSVQLSESEPPPPPPQMHCKNQPRGILLSGSK